MVLKREQKRGFKKSDASATRRKGCGEGHWKAGRWSWNQWEPLCIRTTFRFSFRDGVDASGERGCRCCSRPRIPPAPLRSSPTTLVAQRVHQGFFNLPLHRCSVARDQMSASGRSRNSPGTIVAEQVALNLSPVTGTACGIACTRSLCVSSI
jgi:hypothetical protein